MKFSAKASNDFAPVPSGNHVGICNAVVDLGLQPGSAMYPDPKHQVYIRFELPTEQIEFDRDGQKVTGPMSIGRTFTASMGEKANLRKFIESWFGKQFPSDGAAADFDLVDLLGRRCLLNITHTAKGGKTYANLQTATPLPKGMASTESQANPNLFFDLSAPDPETFDKLPKWLKEKIGGRLNHESDSKEPATAGDAFDDEIPF